ncbi:diacylglycerol kinase family protein [Streptomyces albidochromogenes]|uniref:diacylglycerol kinase family protein n=1 Tax=Streptomyces albidochromogenes TaxID=329524 RepID=UPI0031DBB721
MTTGSGAAAGRIRPLLLLPPLWALMVGAGLLITGPAATRWPLVAEGDANAWFARHRTGAATAVSEWLTLVASTESVIGVTVVCVVALVALPRVPRWREAVFLGGSVAAQSALFLLITLCVQRPRPVVSHLDPAPPTSSFPSGHVGASVALYGGLAALVVTRLRGPWRYAAAAALLVVPPAVAVSRLYRGMHHPSDVVGGLVNGVCTLLVIGSALLASRGRPAPAPTVREGGPLPLPRSAEGAVADARGVRRVVVVRHPLACAEKVARQVREVLVRHGCADVRWTSTTAERPCGDLGAYTAAGRVDVVVVCGGDGTVRACADELAGSGTALAVVPCGTGNLLARNLGLPVRPAAALDAALRGDPVRIDVGRVSGDGLTPTRFTVMAGAGFDALMVRDASPRLKVSLGWLAYVVSAVRHLGDPAMRLTLRLDNGDVLHRRARMVVVGNVGALQGGVPLLPDARPDSGRLEVVLLGPRGGAGWLAVAAHLLGGVLRGRSGRPAGTAGTAGEPAAGTTGVAAAGTAGTPSAAGGTGRLRARGALEYFSAARVDLRFAGPQAREVDGDCAVEGTRLVAEVEPAALLVQLPRSGRRALARPSRATAPAPAPASAPGASGPRPGPSTGPVGASDDDEHGDRHAGPALPARPGRGAPASPAPLGRARDVL